MLSIFPFIFPYSIIRGCFEDSMAGYGIIILVSFAVIVISIHALIPNYIIACLVSGYYAALCVLVGFIIVSLFGLFVQGSTFGLYLPFGNGGSLSGLITEFLGALMYFGMLGSMAASVFGIPVYFYRDS